MKRLLLALALAVTLFSTVPAAVCNANSAPPPSIIIAVSNAPDDLVLSIGDDLAEKRDKPFLDYFIFQQFDLPSGGFSLQVTTGATSFSVPITTNKTFNNYFMLDLDARTLTSTDSLPGAASVPVLMLVLTLVIEGIVFYAFGYRQRRSWLTFLAVNLVTQAALIAWLSQDSSLTSMYAILTLVFGEIFVFIAEMVAFMLLLKEHSRLRRASYVILANFLSLFLGGYLISVFTI